MRSWYIFALALLSLAVAVVGLRLNSTRVGELKNDILAKDLAGANVKQEVGALREFVFSHMNSSVTFELTGSYERATLNLRQAGVTGEVYDRAQAACDRQGVSSVEQAQCVQDYLQGRVDNSSQANLPLRSQYRYSFASPNWSPDMAGFGLLGAATFFIWGIILYIKNQFRARNS